MHPSPPPPAPALANTEFAVFACSVEEAWFTPITLHYTGSALSAGKLCSVHHFQCLFTLSCSRQLTMLTCICLLFIWTVFFFYLTLFAFVCFQHGYRRGFLSIPAHLPPSRSPPCLSRLRRGVVYVVTRAVRSSLSAFPLSSSIQR